MIEIRCSATVTPRKILLERARVRVWRRPSREALRILQVKWKDARPGKPFKVIAICVPLDDLEIIDRGAARARRSRSAFMREAALARVTL